MPIYEYWCRDCSSGFDKLQPIGASSAEAECPRCGAPAKKMLSLVAAVSRHDSSAPSEARSPYQSSSGGCACGGHCGCGGHH
jgi:putative FmdB family regulatory protein